MNRPTVGIDARMWGHPGIGRYIREMAAAMADTASDFELSFLRDDALHSKIYSLSEQWEVFQKTRRFDLLHVPHFNVPFLRRRRFVATIHDLTYLHDASAVGSGLGREYVKRLLAHVAKNAEAVITVSDYTRNDFLNNFPAARPERVYVTPEAASPVFKASLDKTGAENFKKKFSLNSPFVLFVGTLKPHKNALVLLEAMQQMRAAHGSKHELVIVGKEDAKHPEILKGIKAESFARFLGPLSDEDLVSAYRAADLFVLPSASEGFGLPLLEAMACGCPVLGANRTSIPEIVGQAGAVFDPGRIDALAELIYNVLQDNELRKKMSHLGLERVKEFSWQKLAQKTLQIYQKALA